MRSFGSGPRLIPALLTTLLLAAAGCRTSDDAAAAASQMAKTSQALCRYYKALGTTMAETDDLFRLNEALYARPYSSEARRQLTANRAEVAKRAQMASDLSILSENFGKLSGSTEPADAASAAAQVASDAAGLAGVTVSTGEQDAFRLAVLALGRALQEHREREAAKAMEGAAESLSDLFAQEMDVWRSTEQVESQIAANLAANLVDQRATDNSGVLGVALARFGLAPGPLPDDMNAKLAPVAKQQIAAKHAAMDAAYESATASMANALRQMAQRIQQVAEDQPMALRTAPASLAEVEQWAARAGHEPAPAPESGSGKAKDPGGGQEN